MICGESFCLDAGVHVVTISFGREGGRRGRVQRCHQMRVSLWLMKLELREGLGNRGSSSNQHQGLFRLVWWTRGWCRRSPETRSGPGSWWRACPWASAPRPSWWTPCQSCRRRGEISAPGKEREGELVLSQGQRGKWEGWRVEAHRRVREVYCLFEAAGFNHMERKVNNPRRLH